MRIERLKEAMLKDDYDLFLMMRDANILYFTGTISGGILLAPLDAEPVLLVPQLNLAIAQEQAEGFEVKQYTREDMLAQITGVCRDVKAKKIGFDKVSLRTYEGLTNKLNGVEFMAEPDLVWEMRKVKDVSEIESMKKAAKLTDFGMEAIRQFLRDGVREYEVAAEASYAMRKEGAENNAFPFIVASGPRSAFPHAGVTSRKIKNGDFVTIDMGAKYHEYCTDLTRTFIVGSPSREQRTIYEAVKEANATALPQIKQGAKGADVDQEARNIIEEKGYGPNFVHSLGHGVGLEVHEPPALSKTSKDVLTKGNVVTDEPGIYIPGFGGVRIEDTVLVTCSNPVCMTRFNRDLDSIRV